MKREWADWGGSSWRESNRNGRREVAERSLGWAEGLNIEEDPFSAIQKGRGQEVHRR